MEKHPLYRAQSAEAVEYTGFIECPAYDVKPSDGQVAALEL